MAKYIDVESLVVGYSGHTPDDDFSKGVDFVLDLLDSKQGEDVRPVVRSRWIYHSDATWKYECEKCGCYVPGVWSYCPGCGSLNGPNTITEINYGADMGEGSEE